MNIVVRFILYFICCIAPAAEWICAQTPYPFDVDLIPAALTNDAVAVVRNSFQSVEVKPGGFVIYNYKYSITILNADGKERGQLNVYFNASQTIKSSRGKIFDRKGKLVKEIPAADFKRNNLVNGYSFFLDAMVLHYSPSVSEYPYTIEYEYEIKDMNSLYFPTWYPHVAYNVAVENSSLLISNDPSFPLRYKQYQWEENAEKHEEKNRHVYKWNIKNRSAIRLESFSLPFDRIAPNIKIAPVRFSYEGTTGEFRDWDEYGKMMYR